MASLIIIPSNCITEAQLLSLSGRMRKLLLDQNTANHASMKYSDFLQWHENYFGPLLARIHCTWGFAHSCAQGATYPCDMPPWFDADPALHWDGENIILPPWFDAEPKRKENKGSRRSFAIRLESKMDLRAMPDNERFAFEAHMHETKVDCGLDNYFDGAIIWP